MVKPAALATKTGTIAVCATPGTLKSERYNWLKQTYAANVHVIEPLCNQWAYMIEHNQINEKVIRSQVKEMCSQDVDVIVLGCTHYHWIEDVISDAAGSGVIVMQPESAIVERVKHELEKLS
jgi:glutamate racemase